MILSQLVQDTPSHLTTLKAKWLSPPEAHLIRAGPAHPARTTLDMLRDPVASEMLLIQNFLSAGECQAILSELDFALWRPSLTYMLQADGTRRDVLSPYRTSETAQQKWFSDELQAIVAAMEKRLEALFGFEVARLEYWQGTNYPPDGSFYYHLDAGYWETHCAGDRILTLLLYLTTPVQGGGTRFRALDIEVQAEAGTLLAWNNLFPGGSCNHRMIHSSVPLLEGKKTTLVTWLRQKKFRNDSFTYNRGQHE